MRRRPPTFIPATPWSHPWMTWPFPSPNLNVWPRFHEASNSRPFDHDLPRSGPRQRDRAWPLRLRRAPGPRPRVDTRAAGRRGCRTRASRWVSCPRTLAVQEAIDVGELVLDVDIGLERLDGDVRAGASPRTYREPVGND